MSGTIDFDELPELREKKIMIGAGAKMMELFTTPQHVEKDIAPFDSGRIDRKFYVLSTCYS